MLWILGELDWLLLEAVVLQACEYVFARTKACRGIHSPSALLSSPHQKYLLDAGGKLLEQILWFLSHSSIHSIYRTFKGLSSQHLRDAPVLNKTWDFRLRREGFNTRLVDFGELRYSLYRLENCFSCAGTSRRGSRCFAKTLGKLGIPLPVEWMWYMMFGKRSRLSRFCVLPTKFVLFHVWSNFGTKHLILKVGFAIK